MTDAEKARAVRQQLERDWKDRLNKEELIVGPIWPGEGGAWVHVCMEVFVPEE